MVVGENDGQAVHCQPERQGTRTNVWEAVGGMEESGLPHACCLHALGVGLFLDNAHREMATSAVQAAKKQLRKELKSALAAMNKQQRQEESAILTQKVKFNRPG